MLERVLTHIHNRFERERLDGRFSVEGGLLSVPGALPEQYVWVEGSVFSDGLHQCPVDYLDHDEEFTGSVYLLAIPKVLIDLVGEIEDWVDANGSVADSPYQSESFGGYTYTKAGGGSSADQGDGTSGWQAQFRSRLNPWRKLS